MLESKQGLKSIYMNMYKVPKFASTTRWILSIKHVVILNRDLREISLKLEYR